MFEINTKICCLGAKFRSRRSSIVTRFVCVFGRWFLTRFFFLLYGFPIYLLQVTKQITKLYFRKLKRQLFDLECVKTLWFLQTISLTMQRRSIRRQTKKLGNWVAVAPQSNQSQCSYVRDSKHHTPKAKMLMNLFEAIFRRNFERILYLNALLRRCYGVNF